MNAGFTYNRAKSSWDWDFTERAQLTPENNLTTPLADTRGDILLDRFWSGRYTFAEAFAMATPTVFLLCLWPPQLGKQQRRLKVGVDTCR